MVELGSQIPPPLEARPTNPAPRARGSGKEALGQAKLEMEVFRQECHHTSDGPRRANHRTFSSM
jgi:hypothetical protein